MGSGASKGPKPVLYICPRSPACRAVLMAAKAAGIELELKTLDLMKGEHLAEDFIKINPDHTVPTLDDNGFKLWESRAIMAYLVDKYAPGHAIYPKEPQKRAAIDRLLYTDLSLVFKSVHEFLLPQIRERKPADALKKAEVEKALEYLEKTLEEDGKFLAGTTGPTLADFSVASNLSALWFVDYEFGPRWPKVEKWLDLVKKLPYYDAINPIDEFKRQIREMQQSK